MSLEGPMNRISQLLGAFRTRQEGTAAIEFAIVGSAMILVSIGIVEFGRGLLVRNEIAHLADVGSRAILIDPAVSDATLLVQMRKGFSGDDALLGVSTAPETVDGIKYRTVSVTYPLNLLVPGLTKEPITLSVLRRVPTG